MQTQNSKQIFEEIFKVFFKSIKQELSPKQFLYKNVVQPMEDVFLSEQAKSHPNHNPSKYIPLIKYCIEYKTPKITEIGLNALQRLLMADILVLESHTYMISTTNTFQLIKSNNIQVIDDLVPLLCGTQICEKDENLSIIMLKIFKILFFSILGVHGENLIKYLQFLLRMFASAKRNDHLIIIKSHITTTIGYLFQRIKDNELVHHVNPNELFKQPTFIIYSSFDNFFRYKNLHHMNNHNNSLNSSCKLTQSSEQSILLNSSNPFRPYKPPKKRENSMDFTLLNCQPGSANAFSPGHFFNERSKPEGLGFNFNFSENNTKNFKKIQSHNFDEILEKSENFTIFEEIIKESVIGLVDEVCLNIERNPGNIFRIVPNTQEFDSYKARDFTGIFNENNIESGKFGWCVICRNSAPFYCKTSRKPVCSIKCKKLLLEKDEKIFNLLKIINLQEKPLFIDDLLAVLRLFSKISEKELIISDSCSPDFKTKLFSLEILASLLDYFGTFYPLYRSYLSEMKSPISELVLKNCLSSDKEFFMLSFKIFLILVMNYREMLREELLVLMEQIFLKVLQSGNSSYSHRFYCLQVIHRIFHQHKILIQFFLNYDCEMGQLNIVEKLFEILSKISQGKYLKEEFSTILQPNQELSLRNLALDILTTFLKELEKGVTECENQTKDPSDEPLAITSTISTDNLQDLLNTIDTENFEKSRAMKQEIAKGIIKFNNKPDHGIKHLVSIGFLSSTDSKTLAFFLRNTPEIKKDKLGEYIAKPDSFNSTVLLEFTNLSDFTNLSIDKALRNFLDLFTLPGEAQQVDRILQAFSRKYHSDNPQSFKTAEVVYLLSYSMMILQTDFHNPQVKEKLKLQDFFKMLKGVNDGIDLDESLLRNIYQGIIEKPLALHPCERNIVKNGSLLEENIKQGLVKLKTTKKLDKNFVFSLISTPSTFKMLLEMIWSPLLAAFSVVFEGIEEKGALLAIEGVESMIKVTSMLGLGDIRDTFVATMIKFVNLGNVNEIMGKNLECLKKLLQLSISHSKYLGNSWSYLIDFLSKLDRLITHKEDVQLLQIDPYLLESTLSNTVFMSGDALLQIIDFLVKACRKEVMNGIDPQMFCLVKIIEIADANMERIRIIWTRLWKKLTEIFSEVGCHKNKKVGFYVVDSLKRLVMKFLQVDEFSSMHFQKEVMISFEKIYDSLNEDQVELKEFLITSILAIMQNFAVKLKAGWKIILSLINFALKENTANLKIMANRMLKIIVDEPSNMSFFLEIPSEFLQTLYLSLSSSQDSIRLDSIDFLLKYLKHLFTYLSILPYYCHQMIPLNEDDNVLSNAEKNQSTAPIDKIHINLSSIMEETPSIYMNRKYSEDLGLTFFENSGITSPGLIFDTEEPSEFLREHDQEPLFKANILPDPSTHQFGEDLWIGVLEAFKLKTKDLNPKVRECGLEALFWLVLNFGYTFSAQFWEVVNKKIIKGCLEELLKQFMNGINNSLIEGNVYRTLLMKGFSNLGRVIGTYIKENEGLYSEVLDIVKIFTNMRNEFLAKLALSSLRNILSRTSKKFSKKTWFLTVMFLNDLLDESTPSMLMERENLELPFPKSSSDLMKGFGSSEAIFRPVNLRFNVKDCLTKCIVQLMTIGIVTEVVEKNVALMSNEELEILQKAIEKTYNFSFTFNEQIYLRYCLWKNGFLQEMKQLPGLLRQEREALHCLLSIDIQAFNARLMENRLKAQHFLDDFIGKSIGILHKFNELSEYSIKNHKERAFFEQIHKKTNILKASGSKTPDVRSHFSNKEKPFEFSSSFDDFQIKISNKPQKMSKFAIDNEGSIENILKGLENKENQRKLNNFKSIISCVINNLNEIKPSDIKNLRKLVMELLNLSKNGFSHCVNCGSSEYDDSVVILNEILMKFYDFAFNKL